jgi:uncharacterized protein (TIGR03435 family)
MRGAVIATTFMLFMGASVSARQSLPNSKPSVAIEVATVNPSKPETQDELFTIRGRHMLTLNTSTEDLIRYAYNLHPTQLVSVPAALGKAKFDLDALSNLPGVPTNEQMRLAMQVILADRFKLKFHLETRTIAVLILSVAASGPKMAITKRQPSDQTDFYGSNGELNVNNASMQDFANGLSRGLVARPVLDETKLSGHYDFVIRWKEEGVTPDTADVRPGFSTAVQEQLGLKLSPSKAGMPVLVVESIQPPTHD